MNNISEVKRQAVKTVLKEMADDSALIRELTLKALQQDWDEEKLKTEIARVLVRMDTTKTYDYYTDRIMSIFTDSEANNG